MPPYPNLTSLVPTIKPTPTATPHQPTSHCPPPPTNLPLPAPTNLPPNATPNQPTCHCYARPRRLSVTPKLGSMLTPHQPTSHCQPPPTYLPLPALLVRVALVHAHQVSSKQRRLLTPCPRPDLQHAGRCAGTHMVSNSELGLLERRLLTACSRPDLQHAGRCARSR